MLKNQQNLLENKILIQEEIFYIIKNNFFKINFYFEYI